MTKPASTQVRANFRLSLWPPLWPWRRIALFLLAYLAASLFAGLFVALFTVGKGQELMRHLLGFVFLVTLFSAIPAAVAIAVVAWRKLDPLKVIPASAAGAGFAGALIIVDMLWYKMFDASLAHAVKFVTAMTLTGLFSGLIFWLIAYRGAGQGRAPRRA